MKHPLWALVTLLLCAVPLVAGAPETAYAEDYRCTQVDLHASVETDGSVYITDQRLFDFAEAKGGLERLTWLYDGFLEEAEITIQQVRLAEADAQGNVVGEWRELSPVTFHLSWRDGGGSASDAWSFDQHRGTLYAFVRNLPSRAVFQVDYLVVGAVTAYDDAGDFNWTYAPENYQVDLENVTATVVLPVPADTAIVPGDNVRAWGHGPADGTVDIGLDGAITFTDPVVDATGFAFGRVMFPVLWLTNLSQEDRLAHQGELQYYWTTQYEESWVDREAYQQILADSLRVAALGLCVLMLLAGLVVYARWGRERPPAFRDDYWTFPPAPGLPPAVVGRLWRWNHESPDDVVATVLDMVRRGQLQLVAAEDGRTALAIPAQTPSVTWGESAGEVERAALEDSPARQRLDEETRALIEGIANDEQAISPQQLSDFAHQYPVAFLRLVQHWQRVLSGLVAPHRFFDTDSTRAQHGLLALAAVAVAVGVACCIWLGWLAGVLCLAAAACLGVLGNYTMRRSPEGNEIAAHAKALRNWLRDGGCQDAPLSEAERSVLVPYAYLFNVLRDVECAPDTEAAELAALAPRLSRAFDDALRAAHHRAEVS